MPTRLLYEKVCTSATLAALSAEEERFFYRLLVQCDDFGRFHADPVILRNRCFQRMEDIRSADVRAWRDRLEQSGLIRTYAVEGEEYLAVLTWTAYQRQRASKPKYPDPPSNVSESPQLAAECGSRVVKTRRPEAEGRRPVAGSRRPVAGTLPKPSPPSGEGQAPAAPVDGDVVDRLSRLPPDLDAAAFHTAAEAALVALGFTCQREVAVDDRGDGHGGRIDLLAERHGRRIAFEFDRDKPREKSIRKLAGFEGAARVVVVRGSYPGPAPPGLDAVISAVNGSLAEPPPKPPPKLEPGEEWIEPGHPEYSPLVGRYKRVRV